MKFTPMTFKLFETMEFVEEYNEYHGFKLADHYWKEHCKEGETSLEVEAGINPKDCFTEKLIWNKYKNYLKKLKVAR
jgi:hypothetical protein